MGYFGHLPQTKTKTQCETWRCPVHAHGTSVHSGRQLCKTCLLSEDGKIQRDKAKERRAEYARQAAERRKANKQSGAVG